MARYPKVHQSSQEETVTKFSQEYSIFHAGGLARVVAVDEMREAPCKASVLFPRSGGNIHSLTAVTPCALLDVLAPPYAEDLGRPSTYFSDIPIPSLPGTHTTCMHTNR